MQELSLLCVFCFFIFLFLLYVYGYGFLSGGKDSGAKLCMLVPLLFMMSFSHFCELWPAGSHGGGITSGIYADTNWIQAVAPAILGGIQNWVPWLGGQSELGAAVLLKTVWWDLRLASLLTHLLIIQRLTMLTMFETLFSLSHLRGALQIQGRSPQ